MFWRVPEQESQELPLGHVRVLVVGDSGVGKSSLVHLIVRSSGIIHPPQTVGCTVSIKHITYGNAGSSSSNIKGDTERGFFVELWDVSGHDRYKDCRCIFYSQINGVIFVHDLSQRRTKASLQKWAAEIAEMGTFSAPLRSGGPGGLPIPYLVIGNKVDIASKVSAGVSSGNLVDVALQWVEKQGLLPSSDELPLTEYFSSNAQLTAAAKEARFDKEAVIKFFRKLIRRRYFPDDLPSPSRWSVASCHQSNNYSADNFDEDQYNKMSMNTDVHKCNTPSPLPDLKNPTPPMPYTQQLMLSVASEGPSRSLPSFVTQASLVASQTQNGATWT